MKDSVEEEAHDNQTKPLDYARIIMYTDGEGSMPTRALEEIQKLMQEKRYLWTTKEQNLKLKCLLICDNEKEIMQQISDKLNKISLDLYGNKDSLNQE